MLDPQPAWVERCSSWRNVTSSRQTCNFQIRVESGGKPVARACPPNYTRNLLRLYQGYIREKWGERDESANAAAPPASALRDRKTGLETKCGRPHSDRACSSVPAQSGVLSLPGSLGRKGTGKLRNSRRAVRMSWRNFVYTLALLFAFSV